MCNARGGDIERTLDVAHKQVSNARNLVISYKELYHLRFCLQLYYMFSVLGDADFAVTFVIDEGVAQLSRFRKVLVMEGFLLVCTIDVIRTTEVAGVCKNLFSPISKKLPSCFVLPLFFQFVIILYPCPLHSVIFNSGECNVFILLFFVN